MHINDLNDDCLKCILSRLSLTDRAKCQRVCRLWRELVAQTFRSQLCLSTRLVCVRPDQSFSVICSVGDGLARMLDRCPNLRSLDLTDTKLSAPLVESISKRCERLQRFECNDCETLSDQYLEVLLSGSYANRLTDISLSNSGLTDRGLKCLLEKCANIRSVNISHNDGLRGESCLEFLGPNIRSLNMEKCRHVREAGIRSLVSGSGAHLNRLRIGTYISRDILSCICQNMSSLSHLSIDAYYYPQSFRAQDLELIGKLYRLKELSLKSLPLLRTCFDGSLIKMLHTLPKLRKLSLMVCQISDKSLAALSVSCPRLKSFEYQFSSHPNAVNKRITNAGALHLIRLTRLRELSLHGTAIGDTIADIIFLNRKLVFLKLFYCNSVSNVTISAFVDLAKINCDTRIAIQIKGCKSVIDIDRRHLPSNFVIEFICD